MLCSHIMEVASITATSHYNMRTSFSTAIFSSRDGEKDSLRYTNCMNSSRVQALAPASAGQMPPVALFLSRGSRPLGSSLSSAGGRPRSGQTCRHRTPGRRLGVSHNPASTVACSPPASQGRALNFCCFRIGASPVARSHTITAPPAPRSQPRAHTHAVSDGRAERGVGRGRGRALGALPLLHSAPRGPGMAGAGRRPPGAALLRGCGGGGGAGGAGGGGAGSRGAAQQWRRARGEAEAPGLRLDRNLRLRSPQPLLRLAATLHLPLPHLYILLFTISSASLSLSLGQAGCNRCILSIYLSIYLVAISMSLPPPAPPA